VNGPGGVGTGNATNGGGVAGNAVSGVSDAVALVLTIQRMVVLGVMQLPFPLYRKQILPSRQEWFALLGAHVNAPVISLNSRLYSFPESLAG